MVEKEIMYNFKIMFFFVENLYRKKLLLFKMIEY